MGESGEKLLFPVSKDDAEVKESLGVDRSRQAGLFVTDDLGRLFDCPDESSVNHVFAIVARGVPVITLCSWRLERGMVEKIPRESVTRHVSLATTTKFIFEYDRAFQSRYQAMLHTMKELVKQPGCKWIVRPLATKKLRVQKTDFKNMKLDGIEVVRSVIQTNRRIVNTCDAKYKVLP